MDRADRALGGGLPGERQRGSHHDGGAGKCGSPQPLRDIEYAHSRVSLDEPPPAGVPPRIIKPGRRASLRTS
jgi:hypothetical protein